jgi:hypothetical protein
MPCIVCQIAAHKTSRSYWRKTSADVPRAWWRNPAGPAAELVEYVREEPDRRICRTCWRKLPLPLRQRWWRETDYGALESSPELVEEIRNAALGEEEQRHARRR